MQNLKKMIRKKHKPLHQIILRNSERDQLISNQPTSVYPKLSKEHFNGPVILDCILLQQYSKIIFENFTLTTTEPDNCCRINEDIINILNFALTAEGPIINWPSIFAQRELL